jgi:hypothetical protein
MTTNRITWIANPDRTNHGLLTRNGDCTTSTGLHRAPNADNRCTICGALATYPEATKIESTPAPYPYLPLADDVPCGICGNPAPAPASIETDPLCSRCYAAMHTD